MFKDIQFPFSTSTLKNSTSLVFIHGNSMSKQLFFNQLSSEKFSDYRLIAFDLIGCGESSKSNQPSEEYNVPHFATLINHVLEKLQVENVYLIGHSLGGHIAIEFAGRYENKLKGLIAVGTPPLGIPADIPAAFHPNPAANLLFQAQLSTTEIQDLSKEVADNVHQVEVVSAIQLSDPRTRENIGGSIINQNYLDEIQVLTSTRIPYALVLGANDKLCNPAYFDKYLFENQWKGRLNKIEHGSHHPFLDQPEEMNELILKFLSDCN